MFSSMHSPYLLNIVKMKVVISVCVFAATIFLVAGAPAFNNVFVPETMMYNEPFRARRSYGAAYAPPCAASLPLAPAGGYYSPAHASYGGGYGGGHAYAAPAYGAAYSAPHYRADESAETDINFSDMDQGMSEHQPMARYGYGGAVASHGSALAGLGYGGQLAPAVASGPAFGVFPNANVGGCNVPLLLSCSPSIVPGRLVKSGYGAAGYGSGSASVAAPNAYRAADDHSHSEHEEHVEEMSSQSSEHSEDATHTETHI